MSQSSTPSPSTKPTGDPWHAFGYLVSGVALYGTLGWLADRWLGTTFLVALGVMIGAGLGMYLSIRRFLMMDAGAGPGATARTVGQEDEPGAQEDR